MSCSTIQCHVAILMGNALRLTSADSRISIIDEILIFPPDRNGDFFQCQLPDPVTGCGFTLTNPNPSRALAWRVHHDEDAEFYINDVAANRLPRWTQGYTT